MNSLIIITGCPGTGKSYWARVICDRFPSLVLLAYDEFKEALWDRYGFENNDEKAMLNDISLRHFYNVLDARMAAGEDLVIEYPFSERHMPTLCRLIERHGYKAVTLYLYGDMHQIYERGRKRDCAGTRHPGHLLSSYHCGSASRPVQPDANTELTEKAFIEAYTKKNYDIQLGYDLRVDVTDYAKIDYTAVMRAIEAHVAIGRK